MGTAHGQGGLRQVSATKVLAGPFGFNKLHRRQLVHP